MSDTPFDHLRIEQLKEEASEEWDFLCPHDNEWHECGAAPCQRTAKMKQRIAELEDAARQVTPVAPESLVEQSKLIARVAALEAEREALGATCPTCLAMAAHVGCPTAAEAWDVIMRTNMQNHDTIQEQFDKIKEQARELAAARDRIEHLEEKREQLKAIIIHSNQRALRIAENLESSTTRIAKLEAERDRADFSQVVELRSQVAALESERDALAQDRNTSMSLCANQLAANRAREQRLREALREVADHAPAELEADDGARWIGMGTMMKVCAALKEWEEARTP